MKGCLIVYRFDVTYTSGDVSLYGVDDKNNTINCFTFYYYDTRGVEYRSYILIAFVNGSITLTTNYNGSTYYIDKYEYI